MKNLGLNELRERFLSFFESKGHLRHPSFSLVPSGDASLLLINAGMAPLKPYFSGEAIPPKTRMTTCQKCIRTPDIERVGKTARHGTFFEMLGNFSFGDYFKKEAIAWAWEFMTKELEIPADRLWITIYTDDDEAFKYWTEDVGVDPSRVLRFEDNFWEIGSGPCGPCSEIHFDRGEEYGCGEETCAVGCECDRYVELWNLVFTQFDGDGKGNYTPLSQKNIDTGMGLERLACIMQGVDNIFEVDTIRNIMAHVSDISGVKYKDNEKSDVSLRVITDHIRSTTMMVSDGVLPSNEGRGYVLRRLLRRAARHGKLLGIEGPFLSKVCETVISESCGAYPELSEKAEYIKKVIAMEEERFRLTIDSGMKLLNEQVKRLTAAGEKVLSGEDAFKLYDTFGFPIDLTVEILEENGLELDRDGFESLMTQQRERARSARASLGDVGWSHTDFGLDKEISTEFTGYVSHSEKAKVLAIVAQGELSSQALEKQQVSIILDRTPFYAESGGQISDTGHISTSTGRIYVENVQKLSDGKYVHNGVVAEGSISNGDEVTAEIDLPRRKAIMRAHSATHLLHKALRSKLGEHVEQAGSLVEPDKLRFDFTHFAAVTSQELQEIEREVNEAILNGYSIDTQEMSIDDAKKLGAMALFGEKYGDVVRVVCMDDYSIELCGGTHLDNTAKAGSFKIMSESSIAAGVRRIEAKVGTGVIDEFDTRTGILNEISELLKSGHSDLDKKVRQTLEELKSLRQEIEALKAKEAVGSVEQLLKSAKNMHGLGVISASVGNVETQALRTMGDWLVDKEPSIVAVLASVSDDKVTFLAVCGKEAVKKGMHAGNLVREVCKVAGGSGGGKPTSAMGGGKDPSKVDDALALVDTFVENMVK
ncbi:MAG: alanine--tRNA ligase [Eubacteriales bacterium]|jgi:alanyl-tRNA synthetase